MATFQKYGKAFTYSDINDSGQRVGSQFGRRRHCNRYFPQSVSSDWEFDGDGSIGRHGYLAAWSGSD